MTDVKVAVCIIYTVYPSELPLFWFLMLCVFVCVYVCAEFLAKVDFHSEQLSTSELSGFCF